MDFEKHFEGDFVSRAGGATLPLYIRPKTPEGKRALEALGPIEGFPRIAGFIFFDNKAVYEKVREVLEQHRPPRGGVVEIGA
jgi:hypothetical protein